MKQQLLKVIKYLLVPIGFLCAHLRPSALIPILMYHRVNDDVAKELSVKKAVSAGRWNT